MGRPLKIKKCYGNISLNDVVSDLMYLTKMDFNSSDVLYSKLPVTIKYSRTVCDIIKQGNFRDDLIMAFARYPINSKKEDMFYTAQLNNVVVDMEALQEQLSFVATMLDFIFDFLCRYLEYLHEVRSEYYEH